MWLLNHWLMRSAIGWPIDDSAWARWVSCELRCGDGNYKGPSRTALLCGVVWGTTLSNP